MRQSLIRSIIFIMLTLFFTACSEQKNEKDIAAVNIGTMGIYEPFSYQNREGQLTGYDIEVLKEINKRLPQYQFNFIAAPWDSLFIGLDADKFQLLANQITSNPDRISRYLLTQNHYFNDISQTIVHQENQDISTLADLAGKKVAITIGDSHARALEDYNRTHGDVVIIKHYESDISTILQDLINGRIDATINNPIMAQRKAEMLGIPIKVVGERLIKSPTIFIAKKDPFGEKLIKEIDEALGQMRVDGTLAKLSIEWFGDDYTH